MKCRKCGTATTRKTHAGPMPGKTMWYSWYFHCSACGWMYMPGDAIRPVRVTKPKTSKGDSQECHQCHFKFTTDRQLRTHTCHKANLKHARELERGQGHYGFYRTWLGY
jgi:hypothetical protein